MAVKLNIGLSRKIGESNYGSRGASINLEVELDNGMLHDPALLRERVSDLYLLARQSVDEELQRPADAGPSEPSQGNGHGNGNGNGQVRTNGHGKGNGHGNGPGNGQLHNAAQANGNGNGNGKGNGHSHGPSNGHSPSNSHSPSPSNGSRNSHSPSNGSSQNDRVGVARATQSQIRAIFAITKRQGLDPHTVINDRFRVHKMEDLSIREASALIDELKNGTGVRS